jgi:hypothetical protein
MKVLLAEVLRVKITDLLKEHSTFDDEIRTALVDVIVGVIILVTLVCSHVAIKVTKATRGEREDE